MVTLLGSGNLFDGDTSTAMVQMIILRHLHTNPIIVKNSFKNILLFKFYIKNFEVNDNGNVNSGTKWVDLNFTGPLTKISGSNGWNVYVH